MLSRFGFTLCLIVVLLAIAVNIQAQNKITVDSTKWIIDGELTPFSGLHPGDTISLLPGNRPFMIFKNINGSPLKPIVIINEGGIVEINSTHYFSISIRHSRYLKLSGGGQNNISYGIKMFHSTGSGLSIGDFTSDIEVEKVEVGYSLYSGIIAKTEPACGFQRNSFLQENTTIHDCYIHHTGTEGMYIGSSFYQGQVIQCDSVNTTVLPPLLRDVNVYNNKVEYTGWDGIQVSSAINVKIHHNTIQFDSQQKTDWQMTGIILGEGSTGKIYNNEIKDGEGTGIFSNGLGDVLIFNNKILNPGKNNSLPSGRYGMYIDDKSSNSGMNFLIFNNLILNPKGEGIRFISSISKLNNKVLNNIIIQEEKYLNGNAPVYVHIVGEPLTVGNNFYSTDISSARFKDISNSNFSPEEGSLLIDGGQSISNVINSIDFDDQPRWIGNAIDIGPYESEYTRNFSNTTVDKDAVFPNPVRTNSKSTITFNNSSEGWVDFILLDDMGRQISLLDHCYFSKGQQIKIIEATDLHPGLNYIQIKMRLSNSLIRLSVSSD